MPRLRPKKRGPSPKTKGPTPKPSPSKKKEQRSEESETAVSEIVEVSLDGQEDDTVPVSVAAIENEPDDVEPKTPTEPQIIKTPRKIVNIELEKREKPAARKPKTSLVKEIASAAPVESKSHSVAKAYDASTMPLNISQPQSSNLPQQIVTTQGVLQPHVLIGNQAVPIIIQQPANNNMPQLTQLVTSQSSPVIQTVYTNSSAGAGRKVVMSQPQPQQTFIVQQPQPMQRTIYVQQAVQRPPPPTPVRKIIPKREKSPEDTEESDTEKSGKDGKTAKAGGDNSGKKSLLNQLVTKDVRPPKLPVIVSKGVIPQTVIADPNKSTDVSSPKKIKLQTSSENSGLRNLIKSIDDNSKQSTNQIVYVTASNAQEVAGSKVTVVSNAMATASSDTQTLNKIVIKPRDMNTSLWQQQLDAKHRCGNWCKIDMDSSSSFMLRRNKVVDITEDPKYRIAPPAKNLKDAEDIVLKYENETVTKFVVGRGMINNFLKMGNQTQKLSERAEAPDDVVMDSIKNSKEELLKRVKWCDQYEMIPGKDTRKTVIPFTGVPYFRLGTVCYYCMNGKSRTKVDRPAGDNTRVRQTTSKKRGCTVRVMVTEVVFFPQYKAHVCSDSENVRQTLALSSRKLRGDLLSNSDQVKMERKWFVHLPDVELHENHPVGAEAHSMMPIDKRLTSRIHELVRIGVENCDDIKQHLKLFVKDMFRGLGENLPHPDNNRYFPRQRDIRNHMKRAQTEKFKQLKQPKIELEETMEVGQEKEIVAVAKEITLSQTEDHEHTQLLQLISKAGRLSRKLNNELKYVTNPQVIENVNTSLNDISKYIQQYMPKDLSSVRKRKAQDEMLVNSYLEEVTTVPYEIVIS